MSAGVSSVLGVAGGLNELHGGRWHWRTPGGTKQEEQVKGRWVNNDDNDMYRETT